MKQMKLAIAEFRLYLAELLLNFTVFHVMPESREQLECCRFLLEYGERLLAEKFEQQPVPAFNIAIDREPMEPWSEALTPEELAKEDFGASVSFSHSELMQPYTELLKQTKAQLDKLADTLIDESPIMVRHGNAVNTEFISAMKRKAKLKERVDG